MYAVFISFELCIIRIALQTKQNKTLTILTNDVIRQQ